MYPCPRCGRRPALQISAAFLAWTGTLDPDAFVLSYQCQDARCADPQGRRTCFVLAADAFQRAEEAVERRRARTRLTPRA